jgi:hypothetical protein
MLYVDFWPEDMVIIWFGLSPQTFIYSTLSYNNYLLKQIIRLFFKEPPTPQVEYIFRPPNAHVRI